MMTCQWFLVAFSYDEMEWKLGLLDDFPCIQYMSAQIENNNYNNNNYTLEEKEKKIEIIQRQKLELPFDGHLQKLR